MVRPGGPVTRWRSSAPQESRSGRDPEPEGVDYAENAQALYDVGTRLVTFGLNTQRRPRRVCVSTSARSAPCSTGGTTSSARATEPARSAKVLR